MLGGVGRGDPGDRAELRELRLDRRGRPTATGRARRCAGARAPGSPRAVGAGSVSRAVKSTGSPDFAAQAAAGIAYSARSAATTITASLGRPATRRAVVVDALRERVRVGARQRRDAQPAGAGGRAEPDRLRVVRAAEPCGRRASSAAFVTSGSLAVLGVEQRRAQRRGHQHRARERAAPVAGVGEHDRVRELAGAAAGEDDARDGGGRLRPGRRWRPASCSWSRSPGRPGPARSRAPGPSPSWRRGPRRCWSATRRRTRRRRSSARERRERRADDGRGHRDGERSGRAPRPAGPRIPALCGLSAASRGRSRRSVRRRSLQCRDQRRRIPAQRGDRGTQSSGRVVR